MQTWPMRWGARWIWAGPPAPAALFAHEAVPPKELWNRFVYLRRDFELTEVPATAPCRVTADSRFVLFVNGTEVGRGPARSTPERLAYETYDLAPYLHPGVNAVAAIVRYYGRPAPWWRPVSPNFELGRGSFVLEAPAIGLSTDASWRGRAAPYRQDSGTVTHGPPAEVVEGVASDDGWKLPGYDDSSWEPAYEIKAGLITPDQTVVPAEPYAAMVPSDIAAMTVVPVELHALGARAVLASDDPDPLVAYRADRAASLAGNAPAESAHRAEIYDAGFLTLATPWIEVEGEAGAVVDIYAGEDLLAGNRIEIAPRFYSLRYTLRGGGRERLDAFDAVGFRYLEVVTRGNAEVLAIGAVERRYPRSGDAFFECDDDRLNQIWEIGVRTLELCSTDAFLDCPGREQRAWVGDSYVHSLLTFVSNGDWRLVRRHLALCAESQRGDGLLNMAVGGDVEMLSFTIPDYSLHWIRAAARYLQHTGDTTTVRRWLPAAARIVDALELYRDEDGLLRGVPGWVFIDWAMVERGDVTAALDALYAAALDDYAWLLDTLDGDRFEAEKARSLRDRSRAAFEAYWDSERGVYVDTLSGDGRGRRVSQQTNAAAIIGGCAPAERWVRILDYVLDPARVVCTPHGGDVPRSESLRAQWLDPADYVSFDAEKNVVLAQPFFAHLLHQAVVKAGRADLIASLCLRWWDQIERGNTTFEEYWDAPPGTSSRCHAWSATPVYDLSTHVLGVKPLDVAYTKATIAPLFGALERLRGRVPTPHGFIELDLDRSGGSITVPEGVSAVVTFNDVDLSGGEYGSGTHTVKPR